MLEGEQNTPKPDQRIKNTPLKELNLCFGIKSFDCSRAKHESRVKTLKKQGITYRDIIDYYFEDNLTSTIISSTQFNYYYRDLFAREGRTKSNVRTLKTFVNVKTRELIQQALEYEGVSKYYDTAFYCMYYTRINALMKRVLRELLTAYVGG